MNITIREGLITMGPDGLPLAQDEAVMGWIATCKGSSCKGCGDTPDEAYEALLIQLVETGDRSDEVQRRLDSVMGPQAFAVFWLGVTQLDAPMTKWRAPNTDALDDLVVLPDGT